MSIKKIYLRPRTADLVIRDPHTRRRLPPEGALMPESSYWIRRMRDGDAIEVDPPQPKPIRSKKAAPPQIVEE